MKSINARQVFESSGLRVAEVTRITPEVTATHASVAALGALNQRASQVNVPLQYVETSYISARFIEAQV